MDLVFGTPNLLGLLYNYMKAYEKIYRFLTEDTPSKTEVSVKKALGWKTRPEDDPNIDPGTKRVRIRKRKKQRLGSILATGGVKRLARKAKSSVYTDTEAEAVEHMLKHKKEQGKKRKAEKAEAFARTKAFTSGSYPQQRGK